jgi:hypothetical protein
VIGSDKFVPKQILNDTKKYLSAKKNKNWEQKTTKNEEREDKKVFVEKSFLCVDHKMATVHFFYVDKSTFKNMYAKQVATA